MIPTECFEGGWLKAKARSMNSCDPQLLERCIHALALLGNLQRAGLPLVFRGGTSLLLHLPVLHRLSIDIDILCPLRGDDLTNALNPLGRQAPFRAWEESGRDPLRLPKRRHFKFFFESALGVRTQSPPCILLDVVEEDAIVHAVEKKPIATPFMKPAIEVQVDVPTVESLLGDKLTAFAPTTTGVPLRTEENGEGDVMQVMKQLFDVGTLFAAATDGEVVADTYRRVQAKESGYRQGRFTELQSLEDTIRACLQLTPTGIRRPALYPDHPLLWNGFEKLRGHLTSNADKNHLRTLAARTAFLAASLRNGGTPDFDNLRYTGSPKELAELKASSLKGTDWEWMEKQIKPVNAEAYHYWFYAHKILNP